LNQVKGKVRMMRRMKGVQEDLKHEENEKTISQKAVQMRMKNLKMHEHQDKHIYRHTHLYSK
jgi:predicted Holliday junction resolvase-like endonuclease